jgi:hypothetical protein
MMSDELRLGRKAIRMRQCLAFTAKELSLECFVRKVLPERRTQNQTHLLVERYQSAIKSSIKVRRQA